jgi:hypothetical protein
MVTIKVPCRFYKKTHPVRKHAMGTTGHQRHIHVADENARFQS